MQDDYLDWDIATRAVRAGQQRTEEGEHNEAIFTTSSFVFANAAEAAERFAKSSGNVYSRFSNPTVRAFQDRLAALENGEACIATASGMAAITSLCVEDDVEHGVSEGSRDADLRLGVGIEVCDQRWTAADQAIGVDLILGPTLTLILFKPRKPGLLFDLAVIAAIQLGALIYGTTVIFQERPYYAVFAVDRFEVIAYRDADASMIRHDALTQKPLRGPILAVASLPEDPAEFQRLLEETVFEGKPDIQYRPEFWSPYEERSDAVALRARSLATLAEEKPETEALISSFAQSLDREVSEFSYVPLVGKDRAFVFVIDAVTAEPIDIIDADPWDNNTT